MNKVMFAFILASLAFFMSCKKEGLNAESYAAGKRPDDSKAFLKDIRSDSLSDYYISGEFDGRNVYLASTLAQYFPANDTTMNAIYLDKCIDLDNIHLVREDRNMTVMIAIYFDKAKIYTRQFPYMLPHANMEQCEGVQMEIINMARLGSAGQGSDNDNFSFWGYTSTALKVQVTNFANDIMEGTFEGPLTTKTGSTILAKNGKFRIKLKLFKFNNPCQLK